jgi:Fungal specific transcription factor domain
MVFCGKPSGGCHACRAKKTKCDKVPEGCTQCFRAKRNCPGYRSQGDLIFRDESTNVARKLKAKEAKKKALESSLSVSPWPEEEASLELVQQKDPHLSALQMTPAVEELAIGFFISNYVIESGSPNRGHLDPIQDMSKIGQLDEGLLSSMKAVGLAGFAHAAHAPHLLKNARYQYVQALQSTNIALRDPVQVKKDSTLMSIMILGIFETITGCRQESLKDWSEHIKGAAAVIKLRGPDQIQTPAGRRLLVHVTAYLMIACMNKGIALPKHIIDYMTAAIELVKTPDPAFIIQDTMMRFSSLRAEIFQKILTDRKIILSRALALDAKLLEIVTNVQPGWEYRTVLTEAKSEHIFNGRYHVYKDYWMSQIWNTLRTGRILLNEMIRNTLLDGFSASPPVFNSAEHSAQFQISTDTIYEMQADILCTVPQHVGYFPEGQTHFQTLAEVDQSQLPAIKMSGGSFLIWPLWLAGILDITTEEVRKFVTRNLVSIGTTMGIKQAHLLAGIVEAKTGITVWEEG